VAPSGGKSGTRPLSKLNWVSRTATLATSLSSPPELWGNDSGDSGDDFLGRIPGTLGTQQICFGGSYLVHLAYICNLLFCSPKIRFCEFFKTD
jgi:hypothetical protein